MALHDKPAQMLKESLDETLVAAKFCIGYSKTDKLFHPFNNGGCLGYPAGILLFSIIDSIGSYFRSNKSFKINIDSTEKTIDNEGWEHFKILNSKYFKQNLTGTSIQKLYTAYRNKLMHNSILGKNALMVPNCTPCTNTPMAFYIANATNGELVYIICLQELCLLCETAIKEFKKDIDTVVPNSKQGKNFH